MKKSLIALLLVLGFVLSASSVMAEERGHCRGITNPGFSTCEGCLDSLGEFYDGENWISGPSSNCPDEIALPDVINLGAVTTTDPGSRTFDITNNGAGDITFTLEFEHATGSGTSDDLDVHELIQGERTISGGGGTLPTELEATTTGVNPGGYLGVMYVMSGGKVIGSTYTSATIFGSGGGSEDVPEFNTIGIVIALIAIIGIAVVILKKKKN